MEGSRRIRTSIRRGATQVRFPGLEILDHSEVVNLSLLIRNSSAGATIRMDLSGVKSLPSGFFGMLLDGVEAGRQVVLTNAGPEVKALIGYKAFVTRGVVHL